MVNIAVIGVGVMGTNHVRVLSGLKEINFATISDIDEKKIKAIASQYGVKKTYTDHKEMLKNEKLDGVVVAVPPAFHKAVVLDCINAGVSVLLEKPIAHNLKDSQEIISKAKEKKAIVLIGHIERFNPVVAKMKELIDQGKIGEIYLVNSVRIGPFPKRLYGLQEGVLIDLSVHDIDIIRYLTGEINQVYSQLIFSGKQEIYARSLFKINKNVNGSSEFSWISVKRNRTIEVYGFKGMLKADYFNQELTLYENSNAENDDALKKGNIGVGPVIEIPITKQEPLKIELLHFIECIKNNKPPFVTLEDANRALEIALTVLESGKSDKVIHL